LVRTGPFFGCGATGIGISKMMVIAAFFPSKAACVMLRPSIASRISFAAAVSPLIA